MDGGAGTVAAMYKLGCAPNAGEESLAHCPATNGRIPQFNCNGDSGDRGTLHHGYVAHTMVWNRTCGYGVVHGCGVDGYGCGICQTNPRCHPCRSLCLPALESIPPGQEAGRDYN